MRNFLRSYRPLADSWTLYDNSALVPRVIAFERRGGLRIMDGEGYEALVARYGTP